MTVVTPIGTMHVLYGALSRYLAPSLPPLDTREKTQIPWIGRQRRSMRRHLPQGAALDQLGLWVGVVSGGRSRCPGLGGGSAVEH
jgi:hypothetical protein